MRNLSAFEKGIVARIVRSTADNSTCVIHSISMYDLMIDVKPNGPTEVKIINPDDIKDTSDIFERIIVGNGKFNKAYNELYYTVNLIDYLRREGYLMVSEGLLLASIYNGTEPHHTIIDDKLCEAIGKISNVRFIATEPLMKYYLNEFKTDDEVKEEKRDEQNIFNHTELVKINNRLIILTLVSLAITAIGTGYSIYSQHTASNETKIIDTVKVKFDQSPIEAKVKIIDTVKVKSEQQPIKPKVKKDKRYK